MLNSQTQHQQQQQQQQHHHHHHQQIQNQPTIYQENDNNQHGYFIFDELSTALQEQQHRTINETLSNSTKSSRQTSLSTTSSTSIAVTQNQQQKTKFVGGDVTYHFKTLVPAVAAGAIIGKGGETIAALQKDTGARVKMSKAHDFYPGTSERVCLITGSTEAILTVLNFIMDKIKEKPDLTTKLIEVEAKQAHERDKQVKVLVPNSTAGMIIGKAGAFIKQIKEESGSYVQISQKPKDITLQERCITVIGDKDNNIKACTMILSKIVEDPQSGTSLNVSYADINGPVANFNPTGSPYAANQNPISSSTASLNSALSTAVGGAGLLVNGTGINLSLNLSSPSPGANPTVTTQLLDHIKVAMRGSGYSDSATNEVCAALGILAKYGVLGVGLGLAHTNGAHPVPGYVGLPALEQAATGGVFGPIGQVNLDSYMRTTSPTPRSSLERYEATYEAFRHATTQAATPITLNNNSFGLATGGTTAQQLGAAAAQTLGALSKSPTPGDISSKDSKNVDIPEIIVGAILGPGGRNLIEIQHLSGANIQISKKGIFTPGTRNRIVTITGPSNAITMAHYLIEQRVNEEEAKRISRQPALPSIMQ